MTNIIDFQKYKEKKEAKEKYQISEDSEYIMTPPFYMISKAYLDSEEYMMDEDVNYIHKSKYNLGEDVYFQYHLGIREGKIKNIGFSENNVFYGILDSDGERHCCEEKDILDIID